eukprot:40847-Chlamydomonas_euryale.AAC.5
MSTGDGWRRGMWDAEELREAEEQREAEGLWEDETRMAVGGKNERRGRVRVAGEFLKALQALPAGAERGSRPPPLPSHAHKHTPTCMDSACCLAASAVFLCRHTPARFTCPAPLPAPHA